MIGKRFRSLPFIFANDNYTLRLRGFEKYDNYENNYQNFLAIC